MSCLDVMYQVYGPPQPYFAAAYGPYHQVRAGGSGEEAEGKRSKAAALLLAAGFPLPLPAEPDRLDLAGDFPGGGCDRRSRGGAFKSRAVVIEDGNDAKSKYGSFPMSQRSFPPSFWNSTYQPSSVPATLSSPLAAAAHSELPFAAADPYAPASLHGHLHQGGPEPWHHAHHHHHHHHPYIGTQTSVRPHRLTPASVPTPVSPPCELGKSEAGSAAAWTTPGPFPNAAGDMAQSLGLNVDAARRYSFCGGSLLS
ncbi:PREDICTED: transcription cofactor vestigial-like protein 2 [Nipponia nippon]|uniref:transcription cofactor vestigial-like protein 2 n=1 Tax=Nipponia nippon TaxID=128390 RepID=UPI0005110E83|nr:PREDICTED: transcription cofactor vestigial-like protein 2 [Nipponia nippon]